MTAIPPANTVANSFVGMFAISASIVAIHRFCADTNDEDKSIGMACNEDDFIVLRCCGSGATPNAITDDVMTRGDKKIKRNDETMKNMSRNMLQWLLERIKVIQK